MQAIACAAKASLISIRSRSSTRNAGALPAPCAWPESGPRPMTSGATPARRARDDARQRLSSPRPRAVCASHSSSAAAPSLMPDEFPAVTVPSRIERRLELGERFERRSRARMFVVVTAPNASSGPAASSPANAPRSTAALHFICDSSAKRSCSSRAMP